MIKTRGQKDGATRGKRAVRAEPVATVAAPAEADGETFSFLVKAPVEIVAGLERERARRGLRSRNETVVQILKEALK